MGFGCHLDARLAVQRALGEVNQAFQAISQSNPRSVLCIPWSEEIDWLEQVTCENQPYLAPGKGLGVKLRRDYPQVGGDNLLEAIHQCKKCVEERGMEILVLDQTRPDLGMPVAKVIVPGLRHFWARFAPGRLYDVPVQMRWLEKPRMEEELNPIPMIL
jgi:ribosomal protein S12 methylthiotransferase accessory factor